MVAAILHQPSGSSLQVALKFVVHFLEMRVGYVSVDLGGGDIAVPQHRLNRAQVGAIHQQVGSKRVAQSVRGDMLGDAGRLSIFADDSLDRAGGQTAGFAEIDAIALDDVARIIEKEWLEPVRPGLQILLDRIGSRLTDEDRAVFTTLTPDGEFSPIQVELVAIDAT